MKTWASEKKEEEEEEECAKPGRITQEGIINSVSGQEYDNSGKFSRWNSEQDFEGWAAIGPRGQDGRALLPRSITSGPGWGAPPLQVA